jgi:hypothetical protein
MVLTGFQNLDYRGLYLIGGLLMLFALFFIGYKKQQRRTHSGKESAREAGRNDGGRLVIDLPFHVARPDKWYRIAAHFDLVAKSKEGLFEHFEVTRHRFTLSLLDRTGEKIINETRPLQDFVTLALSNRKEASSMIGARSTLHYHGDGVPILEFVPPYTGDYRIAFEIPAEEAIKDGSFEYTSKLEHFALSVREDVLPMKSRAYPHERRDLRH